MNKGYFIAILLFFGMLKGQVVSTKDSLKLLPKSILSIEMLNVGASMPINDFGNHQKSTSSGFALPGFKLDGAFNIQLYKHLGIKTMLMWQNNQIDEAKYKKDLTAEDPVNSYTISSGGWNNFGIFIGAMNNFNVGPHYHIQPYILGGFNYGMSPKVKVTVSDSLKMISEITQFRGNATNFCYGAGIDLKADMENGLQLTFGVNAFYCDLKFNGVRVENNYKNSVYFFDAYQPVQTLGFKVGIAMTLR